MYITKNKKGVSEIVSYVLLISIAFGISGIVYAWLTFFVTPGQETNCNEDIALTISDYYYNCVTKELNLTIRNRGLFDVDGFTIRVNTKNDSKIGIYTINSTGQNISVNSEIKISFPNSSKLENGKPLTENIKFLEIQPFVRDKNLKVNCEYISNQKIKCSG